MASATAIGMILKAKKNAKIINSILYRKKDIAENKCPSCSSPYFAKVHADDCGNTTGGSWLLTYCCNCFSILKTEELPIE